MKTGDSRERLIVSQLYGPGVNESKAMGECIALGNSRKPPVTTFFDRMKCVNEYCEVVRFRAKAAPLQAMGIYTSRQLATVSSKRTIGNSP
ncbi:MAG: hypothetical protein JO025_13615 [Verrucomicrobia bacterium]|nr:hypothetical protein [Verrucomicrobiota bacterium]